MPKRPLPPPDWEVQPGPELPEVPAPPEPFEPWEAPDRPGDRAPSPPGSPEGDSDEPADDPDPAAEYVHHMLMLYFQRKIVAPDFCVAMYWASRAGLAAAAEWAKPPGLQSGKYARFLSQKLGHGCTGMFYNLPVPGFVKGEGRATVPLLLIPPHEALEEAAKQDLTAETVLREAFEERELPPSYFSHPSCLPTSPAVVC